MMKYPLSIRLGERQSAEPNTCGSCGYYSRPTEGCRGNCNFKMPPWIMLLHTHAQREGSLSESFENSTDPTMVYDNQTCSFWKPSGMTYVQDRVWTVSGEANDGTR
jgi:hypothetical protein